MENLLFTKIILSDGNEAGINIGICPEYARFSNYLSSYRIPSQLQNSFWREKFLRHHFEFFKENDRLMYKQKKSGKIKEVAHMNSIVITFPEYAEMLDEIGYESEVWPNEKKWLESFEVNYLPHHVKVVKKDEQRPCGLVIEVFSQNNNFYCKVYDSAYKFDYKSNERFYKVRRNILNILKTKYNYNYDALRNGTFIIKEETE